MAVGIVDVSIGNRLPENPGVDVTAFGDATICFFLTVENRWAL